MVLLMPNVNYIWAENPDASSDIACKVFTEEGAALFTIQPSDPAIHQLNRRVRDLEAEIRYPNPTTDVTALSLELKANKAKLKTLRAASRDEVKRVMRDALASI